MRVSAPVRAQQQPQHREVAVAEVKHESHDRDDAFLQRWQGMQEEEETKGGKVCKS